MRQAQSSSATCGVLNSWKEIALYIGRGVRTVQRWERELGLPVHRPRGKERSAVLGIPAELDAWIQNTPGRGLGELLIMRGTSLPPANERRAELLRAERLRAETCDLRARSAALLRKLQECAVRQYEGATRLRESIHSMNGDTPMARAARVHGG